MEGWCVGKLYERAERGLVGDVGDWDFGITG